MQLKQIYLQKVNILVCTKLASCRTLTYLIKQRSLQPFFSTNLPNFCNSAGDRMEDWRRQQELIQNIQGVRFGLFGQSVGEETGNWCIALVLPSRNLLGNFRCAVGNGDKDWRRQEDRNKAIEILEIQGRSEMKSGVSNQEFGLG